MSPPPSFPGIMIKIFLISLVPPVIGGTSGVNFQRGLQRVQVFAVRRPGVCRGLAERLRGLGRGKAARGEDFGIRRVTASVSLSQGERWGCDRTFLAKFGKICAICASEGFKFGLDLVETFALTIWAL
eukprot:1374189-Amorphochlora_amoeboformis.AAC.1